MPTIPPIPDADEGAARTASDLLRSRVGAVPNMYRTLAHAPAVLDAAMAMGQAIRHPHRPRPEAAGVGVPQDDQFYREIGDRLEGKPPRIYLGAEERAASANVVRLEGVWQGVESRWSDFPAEGIADTDKLLWDDVSLQLAKAVGRGLFKVTISPPDDVKDGFDLAVWMADLRNYFPQIQINLSAELVAMATESSQEFIDLAKGDAE